MAVPAGVALLEAMAMKEREREAKKQEEKRQDEGREEDATMMVKCKEAMDTIHGALRVYAPSELAISFNGGKDATVLLHLVMAGIASVKDAGKSMGQLPCVYFEEEECFEEVEEFIRYCESRFGLRIVRLKAGYKEGCAHMVTNFGTKAFFLGTRKSDPHGHLVEKFSPSTKGWPSFMRVHPILHWHYADIWKFILEFGIPYCVLYDCGYTSLGGKHNTEKNHMLRQRDGSYLPAHSLQLLESEQHMERHARKETSGTSAMVTKTASHFKPCSVALITIGNEVLSGKIQDSNTSCACKYLHSLGISVARVLVIPDEIHLIAEAVREYSSHHVAVITMGGIGPTHDDLTLEAVGQGLGVEMVENEEMQKLLASLKSQCENEEMQPKEGGKDRSTWDTCKMCCLPKGTELLLERGKKYPLLRCRNVYMLPGVPQFMRQQLSYAGEMIKLSMECAGRKFHAKQIRCALDEPRLTDLLGEVAEKFAGLVEIGSYPYFDDSPFKTIIVLEGEEEEEVDKTLRMLLDRIPPEAVTAVEQHGSLPVQSCL